MRIPFVLTAATLAALAATAAPAATRDFPARDFSQVDLTAAADVTIRTGAVFSVHAEGDQALVDRLTAEVRGGVLVLGWAPGHSVSINNSHLAVAITMPRATSVAIGGAGSIDVDQASGPAFGANMSGAGTIKVAALHTERTVLAMSGTGHITVAGTTGMLDAHTSGVGSIDASALAAKNGRVAMSGTGHSRARIDGPADVSMSGVGDIQIDGHPTCTVHKSGLGSIRCG
jgi:hypothetical protein